MPTANKSVKTQPKLLKLPKRQEYTVINMQASPEVTLRQTAIQFVVRHDPITHRYLLRNIVLQWWLFTFASTTSA